MRWFWRRKVFGPCSEFQNAELRLVIRDLEGRVQNRLIRLATLERAVKERMPHHDEEPFSCRYLAKGRTALLRIESFDPKGRSDFQRFFAQTFTEIRDRQVTSLILDLRDNGGGDTFGARALLAFLTDPDIALQEGESRLARAFSSFSSSRPRNLPPFGGRVFVLIGKRTASAAMGCAAAIRYYRLGTLVGEKTAEPMQFFGEPRQLTLPHSGLTRSPRIRR